MAVKNEMNRVLGHFCSHTSYIEPEESPEDGEMSEITLPSRHRIRNSTPGGMRPSTLPLGHGGSSYMAMEAHYGKTCWKHFILAVYYLYKINATVS